MRQPILRSLIIPAVVAVVSVTAASGQTASVAAPSNVPGGSNWQSAASFAPKGKILVVTLDHPDRLQTCRIRAFTSAELICARSVLGHRTFLPRQVVALVLPGDDATRVRLFLGFNAGLGAAIWGTVVLIPICPVCAAGTGVAALFCFSSAGATSFGDGRPNRLFYLAPGQTLSHKLGYIEQ